MFAKIAILVSVYALSSTGFSNTSTHETSILKANLQFLQKENLNLKAQNVALESRIKTLEEKIPTINTSITNAQNSANNSQAAANKAQTSADREHSSYTNVAHGHLRTFHDQCVPSAANAPACLAATHRYCNSIGHIGGIIQEIGGDAYGIACFR